MEEKPSHEKGFADVSKSSIHRLSESRPKFKPVLVKKLLADESDDDDSDEPGSNDVNSDEDRDDFDSFQPLSAEETKDVTKESIVPQKSSNLDMKNEVLNPTVCEKFVKNTNINRTSDTYESKPIEHKSSFDTFIRDSALPSESLMKTLKNESSDKIQSVKKLSVDQESASLQSQRLSMSSSNRILEKNRSFPSKELNEPNLMHNIAVTQVSENKDRSSTLYNSNNVKDVHDQFSGSDKNEMEKICKAKGLVSQSTSVPTSILETPMKIPHGTTRPNPCTSHRNIFQTPQNKMNSEIGKTPQQTPATIFSHWSQQHMVQTPLQNHLFSTRDSLTTPATSVSQLKNRHEITRNRSDCSSVRRPLEPMVPTSSHPGTQLSKLQEVSNECLPCPSSINQPLKQENIESQSTYSTAHTNLGHKENNNPNSYKPADSDGGACNKQKLIDSLNSVNSYADNNLQLDYHNMQHLPRTIDPTYKNYQMKQNQSMHPPVSQADHISSRQRPNQSNVTCFPKLNKVITVNNSQYLVLGKLGQGMSCEVLWVYDLLSSEARAIKVVNLNKMDKEAAKGCLQEIVMLDKLKAPCIVHMYSYQVVGSMVYVVMEVGDTDLSRLVKSMLQEKKKIPLTTILYYWIDMLTAVKHIHEKGTIHSDLKPANFLFVRGRLKLIDFGIASSLNADMTSVLKDSAIGTLNYISPEALLDVNNDNGNNDSPNHKVKYKISYTSDVWSLGCILYQLIYGTTPFSHIRQQWAKIRTITDPKHKINYPDSTGSDPVPLILIEVMKKCLQHDPKKRPTVSELLEVPYLQSNTRSKNLSLNPQISIKKILIKIKNALTKEEWDKFSEDYSIQWDVSSKDIFFKIKVSLTDEELNMFTEVFK